MKFDDIRRDMPVFVREGDTAVGAVRDVAVGRITIYIEAFGDIGIAAEQVASVHDGKVVLDIDRLPDDARRAIEHAHDQERDDPL